MLSAQTVFISFVLLFFLPFFSGYGICKKLNLNQTFYGWFLIGSFLTWGLFEFVLVPMIYLKLSFFAAWAVLILISILTGVYGLYRFITANPFTVSPFRRFIARGRRMSHAEYLLFSLTLLFTVCAAAGYLFFQFDNTGDAHYIVSAADMLKTGRLFLSDNASGKLLNQIPGNYSADLSSPWSFIYAYVSAAAGTSPLIAAHLIIPVQLLALCSCIYLLFSDLFFDGQAAKKLLFITLVWLIQLLGYYSPFTTEAGLMTCIWQGPSLVGALGIPFLITCLMRLYEKPFSRNSYLLLGLVDLSLCFMDRCGVILGLLLIMVFCISYSLVRRDLRIALFGGSVCIININYWILADSIKNGIHFSGSPSTAEVLQNLQSLFETYYGNGRMLVLAASCLIILSLVSRKALLRLIYPVLIMLILILYPFFYNMIIASIPQDRLFWLFPEYLFIGLALTFIIARTASRKNKVFGMAIIALLLLISGYNTYQNAVITEAGNLEKINPGHKKIFDYLLSKNDHPKCLMKEELLSEARQYNADFVLPYSLKANGSLDRIPFYYTKLPDLMTFPFRGTYKIYLLIKDRNFDYILVPTKEHMRVKLLHRAGFRLMTKIDDTIIYHYQSPEEYQFYLDTMALIHIYPDKIYKAVRKLDAQEIEILRSLDQEASAVSNLSPDSSSAGEVVRENPTEAEISSTETAEEGTENEESEEEPSDDDR